MERRSLRCLPRKSYSEMEEPNLDEYVFCEKCADFVYEYCSIHGPLLVIPDDKVPTKSTFPDCVPRAALTIPRVFLHIAQSIIPGAGLGVFSTLTLPRGVRFGPYRGRLTKDVESSYCWQIRDSNNKRSHAVDASDARASNWMRYVNCARHWHEQNLVAYQYQGHIYYRTIKIIPRFTELLVFYGSEFASALRVDLRMYNSPAGYAQKFGAPAPKKVTLEKNTKSSEKLEKPTMTKVYTVLEQHPTKNEIKTGHNNAKVTTRRDKKTKQEIGKKSYTRSKKINDKNNKLLPNSIPNETVNLQNNYTTAIICDRCGLIFKCNDTLQFHLKTHKSEIVENSQTKNTDSFKENDCRKKIIRKINACDQNNNLECHLNKLARGKIFKCEYCDKQFTQKNVLNIHIRIHTGEKPYKCNYCNKQFAHKISLNRHIRVHTGEKPYKCNYCNKQFAQIYSLNTHIRTHTGEKPYKCNYCNKQFAQINSLNIHIRTHTGEKPYKCNYCNKQFAQINSLNIHIRTHTGEKPYKCNYCNKQFAQKNDLNRHIRIHTGEKPYKCNYCNKQFARKNSLNIHIGTHTG